MYRENYNSKVGGISALMEVNTTCYGRIVKLEPTFDCEQKSKEVFQLGLRGVEGNDISNSRKVEMHSSCLGGCGELSLEYIIRGWVSNK
jgi:hypothetical protein